MNAGLAESPVENKVQRVGIWLRIHEMFARRYPDSVRDPDYERKLRELEGQIMDIEREQRGGFRMNGNYNEGGGDKSWKDWILGLVGLAILAWLSRISLQLDDLAELRAQQRQMDKHLESTDSRVDRIEMRIYKSPQ